MRFVIVVSSFVFFYFFFVPELVDFVIACFFFNFYVSITCPAKKAIHLFLLSLVSVSKVSLLFSIDIENLATS